MPELNLEPKPAKFWANSNDGTDCLCLALYFAMIHSPLGEKAAALKYLNKALEERDFLIPSLKNDASFASLYNNPEFIEILRRVNLSLPNCVS